MKTRQTILSILMVLVLSTSIFSQSDDLRIFGYFQNNFSHIDVRVDDADPTFNQNSFLMQQMNLMFAKNFGPEYSAFVNLELTNSFSSQDNIGGFKVEEAWFKYSPSQLFNLKAGVLVPKFNNFNEIKNKTVLMPYVYRPLAYETYFFVQFGTGEFVPTSANVQVYGDIPVGEAYFNYAAFAGNSETVFKFDNTSQYGAGQDSSDFKLFGGRLGLEWGDLQLGVSGTVDRAVLKNVDPNSLINFNVGIVPRTRFGAYLNYSLAGFALEAEYIKVAYKLSDAQKDSLEMPAANPFAIVPKNFDKTFAHVNLTYNVTDELAVYGGYDYLSGDDNLFLQGGLDILSTGASYYLNDNIILKAQYTRQTCVWEFYGMVMNLLRNDYLVGASISF